MHSTEIASENYHFCRMDDIQAQVDNGPDLDHLYLYQSSRGALPINGDPVPLAEVAASNRRWPARSQDEIQEHARQMLAPHMELASFVKNNIDDVEIRRQRTDALHATAMPFRFEKITRVPV